MEGKDRPNTDHSRLIGGSFICKELRYKTVFGSHKESWSLPLLSRTLKVYSAEAFPGFRHVHSPDGLNNPLLYQGCSFEMAPTEGMVGGLDIPRTGEGVRILWLAGVHLSGQPVIMSSQWPWRSSGSQEPWASRNSDGESYTSDCALQCFPMAEAEPWLPAAWAVQGIAQHRSHDRVAHRNCRPCP